MSRSCCRLVQEPLAHQICWHNSLLVLWNSFLVVGRQGLAANHVVDRGFDSSGFSGALVHCRGHARLLSYSLMASRHLHCTSRIEKIRVVERGCRSLVQLPLRETRMEESSKNLMWVAGEHALLVQYRASREIGVWRAGVGGWRRVAIRAVARDCAVPCRHSSLERLDGLKVWGRGVSRRNGLGVGSWAEC